MKIIDQEKFTDINWVQTLKNDQLIFEEKSEAFTVGIRFKLR